MNNFDSIEEQIDKFFSSLPCQSDLPMPEGQVEGKNLDYANLLLDAYSSAADSEIQAITQYLYQHKTIANESISNALLCISMIEMQHLDKLSDLITDLGGKPAYYNSNRYYWNTGNIAYGDRDMLNLKLDERDTADKEIIKQKLLLDIKGEVNAINGYKFLKSSIDDKYIKRVLDKIISDEEVHIALFQGLIKKYLL